MTARFGAVVWDVDGVLIDSEPLHLASFIEVCARHGFAFEAADNVAWIGKSFIDMWTGIPELRTFGVTIEELNSEICDHYVAEVHGGMARAPAPAIVARLAGRGVSQGCASSSPRRIVEANVAAVGVAGHLHAVLGREDVARGKPRARSLPAGGPNGWGLQPPTASPSRTPNRAWRRTRRPASRPSPGPTT